MKKNIVISLVTVVVGVVLMAFDISYQTQKGTAKLVFLHERAFWGESVEININNQKVAVLSNNKYFELEVDPSNLQITLNRINNNNKSSKPEIQANLTTMSDKVYYLKIYREIDYFTNELRLVRIGEQTAMKSIKTMKLEQNF